MAEVILTEFEKKVNYPLPDAALYLIHLSQLASVLMPIRRHVVAPEAHLLNINTERGVIGNVLFLAFKFESHFGILCPELFSILFFI